jgi:membrane-associated phospholipid phosphatase
LTKRFGIFIAAALAGLLAAHALDNWAYATLSMPRIYDVDAGRMLRTFGFLPFWWIAAFALWLCDDDSASRESTHVRARHARALFLAGAPTLCGIVGEVAKLLIRRERPAAGVGNYVFRSWSDHTFSTAGLAMPSSHAIIAFGAACALARMFPRAAWLWYALAAGCALTRVMAGAHFLSDVVLSGILAWIVIELVFGRVRAQMGERI